jgi:hypothetical protein
MFPGKSPLQQLMGNPKGVEARYHCLTISERLFIMEGRWKNGKKDKKGEH